MVTWWKQRTGRLVPVVREYEKQRTGRLVPVVREYEKQHEGDSPFSNNA
jgi:hypothetical protein